MGEDERINKVILSRIKKDATSGMVIEERYITIQDKEEKSSSLFEKANKWIKED